MARQDLKQVERFHASARALGCADDEAAFDEQLRAIAAVGTDRDSGKVAGDVGEGGGPKATAPVRKGE